MDEEELGTTGKKITIANFFESIKKIDKVASDALESSNKNFEEIKVAKETLKGLQSIVTSLQTDVQALKENDKIRENERKDRILEQQDAIQKQEMVARAEGVKGEKGDKGDPGAPGSRRTGEDRKATPKEQGFFGSLFSGAATIGSLIAGSPLGIGAMLGGPFGAVLGGMGLGRFGGKRPKPDQGKLAGGMLETMNPFARLTGMFGRKKDEKKEVKEEIKSEIKQELNLKDKKGKGINTYSDEGGEVKKENKLMNFVKQGGVAGFLGRKIFGKKESTGNLFGGEKEEEIPKSKYEQLVDAGYTFDDKGFIGGSRTIEFKGPNDGKETFYSKGLAGILGIGEGTKLTGRYKSVESESELRTLLGEGSGDSLEDIINRDESLTVPVPEKRSLKSKILGGIDAATGNITDFDQMGGKVTGLSRLLGGTIDAATGNFTDIDKEGGSTFGLTRNITGIADFLTRDKFNLDKMAKGSSTYESDGEVKEEKKENKLMNFVKGIGDSIRNFDGRPGSRIKKEGINTYEKGDGVGDDKGGEKKIMMTTYTRDTTTAKIVKGGRLDSLSKGEIVDLYADLHKKYVDGEKFPIGPYRSNDYKHKIPGVLYAKFGILDSEIQSVLSGYDAMPQNQEFLNNRLRSENLKPDTDNKTEGAVVEPVLESNNKDLSSTIYQDLGIDNLNDTVSQLTTQNIAQNGNAVDQNTAIPVPANEPQVSDAEIKNAVPNIPFIKLLTGTSKKYSQITSSDEASSVAGYLD